jgi:uncharacterized membrane protein YdjX (TVP38/TMEM64 family)
MSSTCAPDSDKSRSRFSLRRLVPLLLLAVGIGLFFVFGLHHQFSFDWLRQHRAELVDFVANSGWLAALAYLGIYAGTTALSLPWGSLLTLAGGFLFGPYLGTLLSMIAATAGAFVLFAIAKSALGDPLRARAHRAVKAGAFRRIEAGFQENALSYMLFLRLVPIFPFFVVNLVPAFLGVRPRIYLLGTLIGIIPGTLVYSFCGTGLGKIFERGESFSLEGVLSPEFIGGLAALAVLSIIPVAYKRWRKRSA